MRAVHDIIDELEDLLVGMESIENPLSRIATIEREQGGVAYEFEGPKTRKEHLEVLESLSRRLWHMATSITPEKLRARLLLQPDGGESDLQTLNTYRKLIELPEIDFDEPVDGDSEIKDCVSLDEFLNEFLDVFPLDDENRS